MSDTDVTLAWDDEAGLLRIAFTHPSMSEPMIVGLTPAAVAEAILRAEHGDQQEQLT